MACLLRVEYPGALDRFTAPGNDQQTIVPDETDRTDCLTRLGPDLGQETLPHRWRSANQAMISPV